MFTPEQERKLKQALGVGKGSSSGLPLSITNKIDKIIEDQLGVIVSSPSNRFVEDFGADSLDLVELVMAFEEEFGVDIPDETAESIRTVGDVYRLAGRWL